MKQFLLACAAAAALLSAAPAQDLPKLSEWLTTCSRDTQVCRMKLRDYITAATSQKSMCLPNDVSTSDAAAEMLRWLRAEDTHPASLDDQPYDDALYAAALKLYPCAPPPPQPAPEPAPQAPQQ